MLKNVLFGANKYLLRKIVLKRLQEKLKQKAKGSFIGKAYLLLRCLYLLRLSKIHHIQKRTSVELFPSNVKI